MTDPSSSVQSSLAELLLITQPREESGARTISRLEFQHNWALCELLRRHAASDDYCVLIEFHEDVAVINSAITPTHIDFYQVKATERLTPWSRKELTRRSGDKGSILGKLYSTWLRFPRPETTLHLVSTAPFSIQLLSEPASISRPSFGGVEISQEECRAINEALQAEHALTTSPVFESVVMFTRCDLSVSDHATHATGKLSEFLRDQGIFVVAHVAYEAIQTELKRRIQIRGTYAGLPQLIESRGISREHFNSMLVSMRSTRDLERIWSIVREDLRVDGMSPRDLTKLARGWGWLEIELANPGKATFEASYQLARNVVSELRSTVDGIRAVERLNALFERYQLNANRDQLLIKDQTIKALLLLAYVESE